MGLYVSPSNSHLLLSTTKQFLNKCLLSSKCISLVFLLLLLIFLLLLLVQGITCSFSQVIFMRTKTIYQYRNASKYQMKTTFSKMHRHYFESIYFSQIYSFLKISLKLHILRETCPKYNDFFRKTCFLKVFVVPVSLSLFSNFAMLN